MFCKVRYKNLTVSYFRTEKFLNFQKKGEKSGFNVKGFILVWSFYEGLKINVKIIICFQTEKVS